MQAYIDGDATKGDEKMEKSKDRYSAALAECGEVAQKMGDVSVKFEDL